MIVANIKKKRLKILGAEMDNRESFCQLGAESEMNCYYFGCLKLNSCEFRKKLYHKKESIENADNENDKDQTDQDQDQTDQDKDVQEVGRGKSRPERES